VDSIDDVLVGLNVALEQIEDFLVLPSHVIL